MNSSLAAAIADGKLVQSFSGVRTVLGMGPGILPSHKALAVAYGYCYLKSLPRKGALIIGRDPRPTGSALVEALAAGFQIGASEAGNPADYPLVDLGIITTPLAQTAVRALKAAGGVMITASHNPLDHNGFKFLTGVWGELASGEDAPAGALLSAVSMERVINAVRAISDEDWKCIEARLGDYPRETLIDALKQGDGNGNADHLRVQAERAYLDSIGQDWGITPHCLKPLRLGPVLLDPNGGAASGIDARVLEHFGVRVIEVNAELGYPEHSIDTDGIDPATGRHVLLRVARAALRERAHFGVAFDYDADRGNLVLPGQDSAAIPPPQQVASFNIAVALSRRGDTDKPLAVVMSDATSLASHKIAKAFGARIIEVETGEINVVTRMDQLRREGWDVPVGVEGANGGTVFGSATCRDGLQIALGSAEVESSQGVLEQWLKLFQTKLPDGEMNGVQQLMKAVPVNAGVTLKMQAPPVPQGDFKKKLEMQFSSIHWDSLKERFDGYQFQNFEQTQMVETRTGDESGGWRVLLTQSGEPVAFIFARASRTEAGLWRVIVDCSYQEDLQPLSEIAQALFGS